MLSRSEKGVILLERVCMDPKTNIRDPKVSSGSSWYLGPNSLGRNTSKGQKKREMKIATVTIKKEESYLQMAGSRVSQLGRKFRPSTKWENLEKHETRDTREPQPLRIKSWVNKDPDGLT